MTDAATSRSASGTSRISSASRASAQFVQRAARHLARHRARRAALPDRAERLRQEHAAQHHRRPAGADHRHRRGRRQAGARAAAARHRLRVPGERAVSLEHGASRTSSSAWCSRACRRPSSEPRARKSLEAVGLAGFLRPLSRRSFPAACASARRWPARSACETDILLMDEPFGALDEQTRMILGEDLSVLLSRTDKTIVFVTHSARRGGVPRRPRRGVLGAARHASRRSSRSTSRIRASPTSSPRRNSAGCATRSTGCCTTKSARRSSSRRERAGRRHERAASDRREHRSRSRAVQVGFVARR